MRTQAALHIAVESFPMAFDITVQNDLKKLRRGLNALETKVAPQATIRTLNRVAESAKVVLVHKHTETSLALS